MICKGDKTAAAAAEMPICIQANILELLSNNGWTPGWLYSSLDVAPLYSLYGTLTRQQFLMTVSNHVIGLAIVVIYTDISTINDDDADS